jgi:hypothetical protein
MDKAQNLGDSEETSGLLQFKGNLRSRGESYKTHKISKRLDLCSEGVGFEHRLFWLRFFSCEGGVEFFFISQCICNLYTYIKYNQQIVCWEARAGRGVLCSTSLW